MPNAGWFPISRATLSTLCPSADSEDVALADPRVSRPISVFLPRITGSGRALRPKGGASGRLLALQGLDGNCGDGIDESR
jgi:hypothetical protein